MYSYIHIQYMWILWCSTGGEKITGSGSRESNNHKAENVYFILHIVWGYCIVAAGVKFWVAASLATHLIWQPFFFILEVTYFPLVKTSLLILAFNLEEKKIDKNICFQTHLSSTHWNVSPLIIILTVGMKLWSNWLDSAAEIAIHLLGEI